MLCDYGELAEECVECLHENLVLLLHVTVDSQLYYRIQPHTVRCRAIGLRELCFTQCCFESIDVCLVEFLTGEFYTTSSGEDGYAVRSHERCLRVRDDKTFAVSCVCDFVGDDCVEGHEGKGCSPTLLSVGLVISIRTGTMEEGTQQSAF